MENQQLIAYSVIAIATAFCILTAFVIWILIKLQKILCRVEILLEKTEPETLKLIQSTADIAEDVQFKLTALDSSFRAISDVGNYATIKTSALQEKKLKTSSDWIQGAILGLKLIQSFRRKDKL